MTPKAALIIAAGVFLLYYRFAFAWTPFWVDATVIAVAAVFALVQAVGKAKAGDEAGDAEKKPRDS